MRMSGYPSKTESMGFTRNGRWLATAGADTIVLWPFFGGGPMGKAPMEMAGGDKVVCTRVAAHPKDEVVAAGFADGLVVLADIAVRAHPARRAAGPWRRVRAGVERRTAPGWRSAPRPGSPPSSTLANDRTPPMEMITSHGLRCPSSAWAPGA